MYSDSVNNAELDYAFLAEYAKVESNKLTVVGASYTQLLTPEFPAIHLLTVAGRVRVPEDYGPVKIGIRLSPPDDEYTLEVDSELQQTEDMHPYDGKVGLVFAFTMQIPITKAGLYQVFIDLEGVQARRLAFEAKSPSAAS